MPSSARNSLATDIVKRYLHNKAAVVGAVILIVILFGIIFANLLVPSELVTAYNTKAKLQTPNAEHWFGTDNVGRDLFTRVLYGARISVGIGVGATLLSLIIGAAIASVCALSKKADFVIMRVVDVVTCIPGILLALVLLAVLGGSVFNMVLTLTIVSVPGFVLHIRAVVLGVVEQDYVKAARISGTKSVKLVLKHILPNAIDPIIVDATMTISGMMLSAAGEVKGNFRLDLGKIVGNIHIGQETSSFPLSSGHRDQRPAVGSTSLPHTSQPGGVCRANSSTRGLSPMRATILSRVSSGFLLWASMGEMING